LAGSPEQIDVALAHLEEIEKIDLTIDGADEIDGDFHMIKGGGGALLREKVVAGLSKAVVIVVGRAKVVGRLGTTFKLPVEVVPFARPVVAREIERLGARPILRLNAQEQVYMTDNGNEIFDCVFADGIADARALEAHLARVPGVAESGLFIDLATAVVIGADDGTCEAREKP